MAQYYYTDTIADFLSRAPDTILGVITGAARSATEPAQQDAWVAQCHVLQESLEPYSGRGRIFFEFTIPRIGKRVDVVLLIDGAVFVVEFKVGERQFRAAAIEQVWDYALDLQSFHETSADVLIAPVLVATGATSRPVLPAFSSSTDKVLRPILAASAQVGHVVAEVLRLGVQTSRSSELWASGRYRPTPTIIEAARALYSGHSVMEIGTRGADAKNLAETSEAVIGFVHEAHRAKRKAICFVTGVPGAGKTLVGLNISNTRLSDAEGKAVYLSGNGPLVKVLQEALARDRYEGAKKSGEAETLSDARRAVSSFIQNVHHFRDAYLEDQTAPHNHIAVFDEAQRAWDRRQTERFMKEKKGIANFGMSEPEFLISCMNRHDWAVIVCLVGGGQEINRGEAGISSWMQALVDRFPDWVAYVSPELTDSEYSAWNALVKLRELPGYRECAALHLSTSMRSFRAAGLATLVKSFLDLDVDASKRLVQELRERYPIVVTRSLVSGKKWVREMARGSQRYGLMVSSQAQRLKPLAIDVRVSTNPVHYFLKDEHDVRSSNFLEDAATEFDVQGLELDWSCVVWDGDFHFTPAGWAHSSFRGNRWEKVSKPERQSYLKNAYRVLLTRARQGMVIVVPEGSADDHTRAPAFYDGTYGYLKSLGLKVI
jgi:hypothetical protein